MKNRILLNKELINGFYVYVLLDPSTDEFAVGELILPHRPFYIGKGKEYRAWDHEKEKLSESCNKHKIYKILKIKEDFGVVPIVILKDGLTDDESLFFEEYYAEMIGYDNLTNINPCGVRNPILHGELNGFYGKKHTTESIDKITSKWKKWYHNLSDLEKENYKKTRENGWNKKRESGYEYLPDWTEKRIESRFGKDYRKKNIERQLEKENKIIERKNKAEEKRIERLSKGWKHLEGEDLINYWKNNRRGENNGMFGKGHLLSNENNGRAKKYIVTIGDDVFLINGRLKHFQKAFKKFYNCSDPLRSKGFMEKYKVTISEVEEFNIDGILFVDEKSFTNLDRSYDKCKKSNQSRR